jgi:hypothetical protein
MAYCSRREVLSKVVKGGSAVALTSYLAPLRQAFGANLTSAASYLREAPSVSVLPISNPASAALLAEHFPGLAELTEFTCFAEVSYLITNHGNAPGRAVTTVWTGMDGTASTKAVFHYFRPRAERNPKQHFGLKGNKTRFTANVPLLRPGETKLITPFFCWSSRYFKTSGQLVLSRLALLKYKTTFPVRPTEFPLSVPIQMTIDAVAGDECQIYGPDVYGLGKLLRSTRNAEHDEALSILKLQQGGASTSEIKQMLKNHASGLAFDITPKHDLYYRVRQRQAKVLLRRLAKARPDQFTKTLLYLAKQKRTLLRHVA